MHANEQYKVKGIATIQKISTPWTVIRQGNRIVNAFPDGPSTVDFMGDLDGHSICFEAKQHKAETAFPLKNIEPHQIAFMRSWQGIKFFIIEWIHFREIYRVSWQTVRQYWDEAETSGKGRKSIPYSQMQHETLIKPAKGIVLDYLKGVLL